MAHPASPRPVHLFCGVLVRDMEIFVKARALLERRYGAVDFVSPAVPFTFTDYYEREMGKDLLRVLLSFETLVDPGRLVEIKLETNRIEAELTAMREGRLCRTINLDPGYLDSSKVVLATAKTLAHRVYLGQGIYAEVTLTFGHDHCRFFDWTYADYRSPEVSGVLLDMRRRYLSALKTRRAASGLSGTSS